MQQQKETNGQRSTLVPTTALLAPATKSNRTEVNARANHKTLLQINLNDKDVPHAHLRRCNALNMVVHQRCSSERILAKARK
jgi:hypothetical protein